MRAFGKGDTFDMIVVFLVSGTLVRGVVGATPFFSTIAGAIVILIIHKIVCILSFYSKKFGWLAKGENYLLYKDGNFLIENMKRTNITQHDIFEELRFEFQVNSLDHIKEVYLERTGKIS